MSPKTTGNAPSTATKRTDEAAAIIVAPNRIQTIDANGDLLARTSRPSRARGLKRADSAGNRRARPSRPSRARGLKL